MTRKFVLIAALVLLVSLVVAGAALADTPRGITPSGIVTAIDYPNQWFDVTNNQGTTTYSVKYNTLYFYHPACVVTNWEQLLVGHAIGVYPFAVDHTYARAIVVFPVGCPNP